jgi:hypothetical protein
MEFALSCAIKALVRPIGAHDDRLRLVPIIPNSVTLTGSRQISYLVNQL